MPTEQDVDRLRAEAYVQIKQLEAERDLWRARAMAMFWRLPDDTLLGDLRHDAEIALGALKTSKQT